MSEQQETVVQQRIRQGAMAIVAVLAVIGIAVGVYMTQHHEVMLYGAGEAGELWGCEADGKVNCDVVNTSEWSEVFGVPLFTWAIPTYLLVLGLAVAAALGRRAALGILTVIGLGATVFSGFLYYISVYEIGYVCLWCIRLYGINLAILVLPAIAGATRGGLPSQKLVGAAAAGFVVATVGSVGAQKAYRSQLLAGTPEIPEIPDAEPETETVFTDPEGPLPAREWEVTTEDGNTATLSIEEDDPWKGNPDGSVVIVEFADLQCGYCKRASGELKRVLKAYEDDVLFVFKHYPMNPKCNAGVKNNKHRYACSAAIASVCAQEQGKFWAYHDLAFKNQHQLKVEHLQAYADKVGVDRSEWDRCVRDPAAQRQVEEDAAQGASLDIHGTPRVFVNGTLYKGGLSAQQYARIIEQSKGKTAAEAATAARELAADKAPIRPVPADVSDMQEIEHGGLHFLIDTFEAGLEEGAATVGKHQIPGTRMSWYAARDACKAAGKRLCTEQEWIAACQSAMPVDDDSDGQFADDLLEGNAYPYGDYHERGRCWDGQSRDLRPVYTGEMPGCVTESGVYDLTGNVEEWVGATESEAVLLGGAFDTSKDFARCYRRNDTFGPGLANLRTGFRCCKTP